jgi:ribosomal peptide maturation radical SAM protein 1
MRSREAKFNMPVLPAPPTGSNSLPPDTSFLESKRDAQRVLLICPPFQRLTLSSLSIALLASHLRAHRITCSEAYLHLALARLIGTSSYNLAVEASKGLSGDLFFAEAIHGVPSDLEAQARLDRMFGQVDVRHAIRAGLEERALKILAREMPDIVGITTSFSQLLAALWLCRVTKRAYPSIRVVIGGSGCSEPMGHRVLAAYPDVDFAVSGFGERPLLALASGKEPAERLIRSHATVVLDELPIPDYEPFLEQAADFAQDPEFALAFETSRGCWWGQKNHCRFCGTNGLDMKFVSKSNDRVVDEIRTLWDRHQHSLSATDAVLSPDHLGNSIRHLGQFEVGPKLFFEMKGNVHEADVAALRRANVHTVQPGIESLNSRLLALMNKGITVIRNLALLKWCREYGITVLWSILYGIPGERGEDYDSQLLLMDKIPHFQPAYEVREIRIDRFSPYFNDYLQFGWQSIEPFPEYRWLHPQLDRDQLSQIAYHFSGAGGPDSSRYQKRLQTALGEWKSRNRQGDGLFLDPDRGLIRNEGSVGLQYRMTPLLAKVIEATHEVVSFERVMAYAGCTREELDRLVKVNILYAEREKIINLAVRTNQLEHSRVA